MNKETGILRRLIKGILGEGFAQIANIVIKIFEVPLILHYWGSTAYGEWLLLLAIPAYLALFDFGLTLASAREMTMRISNNQKDTVQAIYQSTALAVLSLLFIILLSAISIIYFFPISPFIGIKILDSQTVFIISTILFIRLFFSKLTEIFGLKLYCQGQYGINSSIIAGIRLLEFGILALVIISGGKAIEAAIAYLLGSLLGTLFMSVYSRKKFSWLKLGINKFSFTRLNHLIKPGLASAAFLSGGISNLQGQILIIGAILSADVAALFNIHRTLSRIPLQLFFSFKLVLLPEISIAYGRKNLDLVKKLFRILCQISIWGSAITCIVMLFFGEFFFNLWTHGRTLFMFKLFALLISSAFINSIWFTAITVATATNRHNILALYYFIVYGLLSLVGTLIASYYMGIQGGALSLLISELAMLVYALPISIKLTKDTWKEWLWTISKPPFFQIVELFYKGRSKR